MILLVDYILLLLKCFTTVDDFDLTDPDVDIFLNYFSEY